MPPSVCVSQCFPRVRVEEGVREVGLPGQVHLGRLAGPALLLSRVASGLVCPQHRERKVAFRGAHPLSPVSAGLRAGRHCHPRGGGRDPMLRTRQRSQLPDLQPAHSQRSASRLPQGRGQSGSRGQGQGPAGVWTPRGRTVTRLLAPRRPTCARGLEGLRLPPVGCHGSLLQPGLWLTCASGWI